MPPMKNATLESASFGTNELSTVHNRKATPLGKALHVADRVTASISALSDFHLIMHDRK